MSLQPDPMYIPSMELKLGAGGAVNKFFFVFVVMTFSIASSYQGYMVSLPALGYSIF